MAFLDQASAGDTERQPDVESLLEHPHASDALPWPRRSRTGRG
jgi:hypothetical protein